MNSWRLTLKQVPSKRIDASELRLRDCVDADLGSVRRIALRQAGRSIELGELFDIQSMESLIPTLRVEGDMRLVDGLGSRHEAGRFEIIGSAGERVAEAMRGGRLVVTGSVSRRPCHRIRRGEVLIEGDVGDGAASMMIAGTLIVAGKLGKHAGYGMARGTIISGSDVSEVLAVTSRFSQPAILRSPFVTLLHRCLAEETHLCPGVVQLTGKMREAVMVSRGDFAVGGRGEWWSPCRDLG